MKNFKLLANAFRVSDRDMRNIAERERQRQRQRETERGRNIRTKHRRKILLRTLGKEGNPSLSKM